MPQPPPPFDPSLFPDTIIVCPAGYSFDADAGVEQLDGIGTAFAASVQRDGQRRENRQDTIVSIIAYTVITPSGVDPGIGVPDQQILWTARNGVSFASPIVIRTLGPAVPPCGIDDVFAAQGVAVQ